MTSKALHHLFALIFIVLFLFASATSCRVVDSEDPITKEPVQTTVAQSIILQVDRLIAEDLRTASVVEQNDKTMEAVVTIHTEEDRITDYHLRRVQVSFEKGVYRSEKIDLPMGNYKVVTFYVLTEDNKVSAVTPLMNSTLGKQLKKALPLPFTVSAQLTGGDGIDAVEEMTITLPTLSTEGKKPEDFGLQSFKFDMKKVFHVFVGMIGNHELLDFKSGRLYISGEGYEYAQALAAGINQTASLPILDRYDIKVLSEGFDDFQASFSLDSMFAYSSNPLLIEMKEETTIECVGGDYPWSVHLASQTEVNNFALRCHTRILGDLIVASTSKDDPIVDLSPLSALTGIGVSLEINNNDQLETLEGLHHIITSGQVLIQDNAKLKTLEGLEGLRNAPSRLAISNNPSLIGLNGLEGLSTTNFLIIHDNPKLENLSGLDQLTKVDLFSIANNDRLTSLQGLHRLREIVHLNVSKNRLLTSLEGFQNGLESIGNLELDEAPALKNLTGMLTPNGKITSSLMIKGTAVTSLEGLSFTNELPFGLRIEDNPIEDISALKSVERIGRILIIGANSQLRSLTGLENLSIVGEKNQPGSGSRIHINNNWFLTDFCALKNLFTKGIYLSVSIGTNGYNPTVEDIKENQCKL